MTLADYALLFVTSYAQVFLMGFQSKNVMHSRYLLAGLTSIGITITSYLFVRYAIHDNSLAFIAIAGAGSSLGIMSAIAFHDHVVHKRMAQKRVI